MLEGSRLQAAKPFPWVLTEIPACLLQHWFRSQARMAEGESYGFLGTGQGEESRLAPPGGHYLGLVMCTINLWSSGSDFSRSLGLGQHGSHLPSVLGGAESRSGPLGTPWCGPG